jgi:hypothetical protein
MREKEALGPGSLRVGRFIGRLGVVSLPAVEAGLDLDQRVVRRHVARLEAAGWLARAPWVWGQGSVVWLTGTGVEGAGLGGVRPVRSPPAPTTIAHGVLVGWSAARVEHRGRIWRSTRELAVERERWEVAIRCDRGYTRQLPDLAVWLKDSVPPVAVIAESGGRREDRQKLILEGWREALRSGQYAGLRYDCVSASVARWITSLAKKMRLTGRDFTAVAQTGAAEIAALPRIRADIVEPGVSEPEASDAAVSQHEEEVQVERTRPSLTLAPPQPPPAEPPARQPETPEAAAERERRYREILGIPEPKRRRRWRR